MVILTFSGGFALAASCADLCKTPGVATSCCTMTVCCCDPNDCHCEKHQHPTTGKQLYIESQDCSIVKKMMRWNIEFSPIICAAPCEYPLQLSTKSVQNSTTFFQIKLQSDAIFHPPKLRAT